MTTSNSRMAFGWVGARSGTEGTALESRQFRWDECE
jgi:hypothetical protein